MTVLAGRENETIKTTVNLDISLVKKIRDFAQKHIIKNQTEFINNALENSIAMLEKEMALRNLKTKIHNIKRVESDVSIIETLREIRNEN